MAYAHTPNAEGKWHELPDHLHGTAESAREFASAFGAEELAYYIGLWHDLGKFNPAFQEYLKLCHLYRDEPNKQPKRGPDHKAAGAELAKPYVGALAMLIQGHHGGLHSPTDFNTWLAANFNATAQAAQDSARAEVADLLPATRPPLPTFGKDAQGKLAFEMFMRLLFSTITDADFLDTERHFNSDKSKARRSETSMELLWQRFDQDQAQMSKRGSAELTQARDEIYQACLDAAEQPQGFFRLTVPTGGGKTRSAMAFALRHALKHNLRRIIVAVPFTTITEQTAGVYRRIFSPDEQDEATAPVVLEHHSGADNARESEEGEFQPSREWSRLAAENWDSPVIVTTTVQLFESLFARSTSRCRKLHRLAGSVIVLDEAQALPTHMLKPILSALRELCERYHVSVVISTATQPAFDAIADFADLKAREIVPQPQRYFRTLKRVDYHWQIDTPSSWPQVAALMREQAQVLTIVNTKKHAQELLDTIGGDALHLSTLLCGAHRRRVVAEVRRRLAAGEPCQLVSTQVVEAGVDLDFPMVLRAIGPLSSIVQAAGRCNRNMLLPDYGRVIIFLPEDNKMPPGTYYKATQITQVFQRLAPDLDDPATSTDYFKMLFDLVEPDREEIQSLRERFDYPEVAKHFKMIDDDTETVVITKYGSEKEQRKVVGWIKLLRQDKPDKRHTPSPRTILRWLQPYTVAIWRRELEKFAPYLEPIIPGLSVWLGDYDQVRGLSVPSGYNLEGLVVLSAAYIGRYQR